METLPGLWSLSPIGAFLGLGALVLWLVLTGRLVPRKTHDEIVKQERTRAEEWKLVASERKGTINSLVVQNTAMLEATKTTAAVVQALPVPTPDGGAQ